MKDVSVLDPTLGRSVKNGRTDTCSTCGHTIPEEHVPLILWDRAGEVTLMWVYCHGCEGQILKSVKAV